MKMNRLVTGAAAVSLLFAGQAFADDFDFESGDFGFGGDTSASSAVEISGDVTTDARGYITGDDDAEELPMDGNAKAKVNLKYSGSNADVEIKLKLDSKTLLENPAGILDEAYGTAFLGNFKLEAGQMKSVWGKGDKLHVIDNFNADDYTDFIIPDYLDRRIATPMVKGSYAFDYSGNVLSNIKLEGIYTPFLPTDKFASSGVWTPAQVTGLQTTVTAIAKDSLAQTIENLETARLLAAEASTLQDLYKAGDASAASALTAKVTDAYTKGIISPDAGKIQALMMTGKTQAEATQLVLAQAYGEYVEANLKSANTAYSLALNNASTLSGKTDIIYPDTNLFEYGQAGARLTASLGVVDLGLSYYYGYYKQPSVNVSKIGSCINTYLSTGNITDEDRFLAYDKKQTFGVEAATILWHFNVRGEACYNLTDDTDGTDPWVHNNSVQWLGGFDIDLPIWNMNVNIQETGTYILKNDEITGTATEYYDVDYNKNGYTDNKLVANITTSFKNDQILPEVTVMYAIESGDVVVLPKIVVKPVSDLSLTASGMYIWTKDDYSQFAAWNKNSFVQLGATYSF